jgi:plastocyanin
MNGMPRGSVARALMAAMLVGGLLAVAVAPAVLAATKAVKIAGFAFAPSSVTVKVGDTVDWTNGDSVGHTATADDGSWDTGTIAAGTKASLTFTSAGTFAYHCTIHSSMHGTIVVEAAAAGSPPPTDAVIPASAPARSNGSAWLLLGLAGFAGLLLGACRFGGQTRRDE